METINQTYDYDMFKFGNWNRDIKENNIRKIDKNVKKEGWKKHPIVVNDKFEVIDGQHRLVYAKQKGLPVYYTVVGDLTAKDCVDMNNVRTQWSIEDFIKLYASQGNENYINLQAILRDYNFAPVSTIIGLTKSASTSGAFSRLIREGKYKVSSKELKDIRLRLDFLAEVTPYLKAVKGRLTALLQAVSFCYNCDLINKSRLKKQLKTRLNLIQPPVDIDMALNGIELVYNYKINKGDYVYIYTEYKKYAKEQQLKGVQYINESLKQKREKEQESLWGRITRV